MGPVVIGDLVEKVGISPEALELMKKIKRNRDAVGDLMWDENSFAWWGSNYRIMNPAKSETARDFRIGKHTTIDNDQLSPFESKAVEHAIRIKGNGWKWPHGLNRNKPRPNSVKYGKFTTPYHSGIVYLASPYSDKDKDVVAERTRVTSLVAAKLVSKEVHAISPVVYGTTLMAHEQTKDDDSWKSWQHFCNAFIDIATAVYIVKLPGWETSSGVQGEMLRAASRGIACFMIDPQTLELEPLPTKLPLYKMVKKDVETIATAYGIEYGNHEAHKKNYDVYSTKNIRIMIYAKRGHAALSITATGEILEPLMGTGMEKILYDHALTLDDSDPKKKEFIERYEKKVRGDAAAKPILDKYLLV